MKTISIIYKYENENFVSRINEKQKVIITPETTKIVQNETVNPDEDIDTPLIENITEKVPAIYGELTGEDLMEWFINNNLIRSGEILTKYFLVGVDEIQPLKETVNNVNYQNKTWEEFPDDIDLYKLSAIDKIKDYAQSIAEQFTKGVPEDEVKSWGRKEIAATNHLAGNATISDTLILQSEADLTNETITELATKISTNSQIYLPVIGKIAGIRRSTTNSINATTITTKNHVDTIVTTAKLAAQTELANIIAAIQGN